MDFRIFIEPQQGADYDRVLRLAQTAERLGFNGFFSSDHYLKMSAIDGLPGPLDTWTTLAGLARDTTRLRLGSLITPVTFRHPGPLAIAVAQIDHMSGGRIELSLGAGWYESEHRAYGIPFPSTAERFGMLEEQLAIVSGLWATPVGERFSYAGTHYSVGDSPALPKPQQQPAPPIIIGGWGTKRTPRLAARYAAEFNSPFPPLEGFKAQRGRIHAACDAIGRDPASLVTSCALIVCCGSTEAEFTRRAKAIGREPGELRDNGLAGSPQQLIDKIATYHVAGVDRFYLQTLDIDDLDHLEVLAVDVLSHL